MLVAWRRSRRVEPVRVLAPEHRPITPRHHRALDRAYRPPVAERLQLLPQQRGILHAGLPAGPQVLAEAGAWPGVALHGSQGAIIGQVTIRDDLHALIDELDEEDAREALAFVKARLELDSRVSQAYIAECQAADQEAHASDAILVPHESVRAWLLAWGTPDEAAADRELDELEQRLAYDTRRSIE